MPVPIDPEAYEKYQAIQDIIRHEWAEHDPDAVMHSEAQMLLEEAASHFRDAKISHPAGRYVLDVKFADSVLSLHFANVNRHVEVKQNGKEIVTNDGTTCAEWDPKQATFVGVEEGTTALTSIVTLAGREIIGGRKKHF